MLPSARFAIGFSILLTACSLVTPKFEKPTISVSSISLESGNLLQQNFRVVLKIHNPNSRSLPIKALSADLKVSGEEIASGESSRPVTVPAYGDAELEVGISANMALALLKLSTHSDTRGDAIAYDVTGVVTLELPFFRSLPFHESGSFDLHSGS
jgi:LEA14-like dessication related protein